MTTFTPRYARHSQRDLARLLGDGGSDAPAADTSAITADADGSVLERLEYIQTQAGAGVLDPATFNPRLGYKVTKAATIASAPDALFDVTGMCEITRMVGEVTSALGTSTSMSLNSSTNDDVIAASTTITSDAIGTIYWISGDPDLGFNGGGAPLIDTVMQKVGTEVGFIMNDDQIEQNVNGAGTGLITWSLWYWPLETGASVSAAA